MGRASRLPAAATVGAAGGGNCIGREELVYGELYLTEHITGILMAAVLAATAILAGDAVVISRNEQLGIPFHADNGELSQGNKQPVHISIGHQLITKAGGYPHWDVDRKSVV